MNSRHGSQEPSRGNVPPHIQPYPYLHHAYAQPPAQPAPPALTQDGHQRVEMGYSAPPQPFYAAYPSGIAYPYGVTKKKTLTPIRLSIAGLVMIAIAAIGTYILVLAALELVWGNEPMNAAPVMLLAFGFFFLFASGALISTIWGAVLGTINIAKDGEKKGLSVISIVLGLIMLCLGISAVAFVVIEMGFPFSLFS